MPNENFPTINPNQLTPYERNSRNHSEKQVKQIMASIEEFGFTRPVVVDESNMILAGHGAVIAASRLNMDAIPYRQVTNLSPEQKKAYVIADNKIAENAQWDMPMLGIELAELQDFGFDMAVTGFDLKEIEGIVGDNGQGGYGAAGARAGNMAKQFLAPPFSILDTKQDYWQKRKKAWNEKICDSGETRENTLAGEGSLVAGINNGVSILDATLAEVLCHWFAQPGHHAFDPFAGDSVFGYVACSAGLTFTGIELRKEQAELNQDRLDKDGLSGTYICDTSENMDKYIAPESMDFVFSCPPYADLEVYSEDPKDLSTLSQDDFMALYSKILANTYKVLKPNRFACIVTSEVRRKDGVYLGLVPGTIAAMESAGYQYYNELILVNAIGTLPIRAGKSMQASRKVGRQHQNVLVFYKGDSKKIKANFGEIELPDMEALIEDGEQGDGTDS